MVPKKMMAPLTFEELYTTAKVRVCKKAAGERRGGASPHLLRASTSLPQFPALSLSMKEASAAKASGAAFPLGHPIAAEPGLTPPIEAEPTGVENEWANQALTSLPGEPDDETQYDADGSPAHPTDDEQQARELPSGEVDEVAEHKPHILDVVKDELAEIIAALASGSQELSAKAIQRMKGAFDRFKLPGESDLHKDDLVPVLQYLGHVMTKKEGVREIADKLSAFEYLDFDEFLIFMEKFMVYEREEFQKVFEEYDEDGSGAISTEELRKLTSHLGFITLRGMMQEALSYVDSDSNGELNFQEFITFLAIYNHSEGFTSTEVTDLRCSFDRLSKQVQPDDVLAEVQTVMPPEDLSDALVAVFGLEVAQFAQVFTDQLVSGRGLQNKEPLEDSEPTNLEFGEFLIVARKVRQAQRDKFGKEFAALCGKMVANAEGQTEEDLFAACDADGSGGISVLEICGVLESNNFTPLMRVIDEIHEEVFEPGGAPGSELDFDEFFDFMLIFRLRDGFLKEDLEKFKSIFDRFDEDGSGEVSALELAEMLRHLGYRVAVEDLYSLVQQVDENGSGQLDYREYIRLMRLFREQYLGKIKKSFNAHREGQEKLPPEKLGSMLQDIGQELPADLVETPPTDAIIFEDLVDIADTSRQELVVKERRKAGFTDDEIVHFQELFDNFDKDKSGDIDNMELQTILQEFGFEPRTKEEQSQLIMKLNVARAKTREAGVKDVAEDGSTNIRFWTFVQLMRGLRTEHDQAQEDMQAKLQVDLSFSEGEIEEFRQIFRMWCKRIRDLEADLTGKSADDDQGMGMGNKSEDELPTDGARRLVRSLGCTLSVQNQAVLDEKVSSLDTLENRKGVAKINFFGFIRLMRWLLDTNFAGINDSAANRR